MAQNPSIAARIAALEAELCDLKQQQQAAFIATIGAIVGHRAFTAAELWAHARVSDELAALFVEHAITSTRKLGKRLQQFSTGIPEENQYGLARIGCDHHAGAIWRVFLDSPPDPCTPIDPGV